MASITEKGKQFLSYTSPFAAASVAVVPVYYGLVAKSALQIGQPLPKVTFDNTLLGGVKAIPGICMVVGVQIVFQNMIEKGMRVERDRQLPWNWGDFKEKMLGEEAESQKPLSSIHTLGSSLIVGVISTPSLAVFNGRTLNRTWRQSLSTLCLGQTAAIVTRETSFLFSLKISGPVSEAMKKACGDNRVVEYGTAFATGAIGSVIGHPADTALTVWQKGMKLEGFQHSMRGAPVKAIAIGSFTVIYKVVQNMFDSMK